MEPLNNKIRRQERKFRLWEHPWLSLLVFIVATVFSGALTGTVIFGLIAPIEIQALYGVIISLGIIPTILMILWTRFFASRWLPDGNDRG